MAEYSLDFGIQIEESKSEQPLTPFKFSPLISQHLPPDFHVNYKDSF